MISCALRDSGIEGAHHPHATVTAAADTAASDRRACRSGVLHSLPCLRGYRQGRRPAHRRGECPEPAIRRIRERLVRTAGAGHAPRRDAPA